MTGKDFLPMECRKCEEELHMKRKRISGSIEPPQKQVEDIDSELFWTELGKYWYSGDLEKFRELWKANPKYIQEYYEDFKREMADPDSELRRKHDAWWAERKPKLVAELGEEYWLTF